MVDIIEVAEKVYLIDNRLYSIPELGSVYLVDEEKKALIDTGPATSAGVVLDGIRESGIRPEEIDYLIVTHIHLDHAGGAGALLKEMPHAQVIVHHRGARHLIDPAKLISSVIAAQGERALERDGEVIPVAEDRVKTVGEGDVIRLGGKQLLKFIDAPGHAPHELCIQESRNGGLFVGDTVGIFVAGSEVLLPVTPPPSFDAGLYLHTLERLMQLKATAIYFAHFGASGKYQEILRLAMDRIHTWSGVVAGAVRESGFEGAAEKLKARLCLDLEPVKRLMPLYEHFTESIVPLNIAGYMKYYKEKHTTG